MQKFVTFLGNDTLLEIMEADEVVLSGNRSLFRSFHRGSNTPASREWISVRVIGIGDYLVEGETRDRAASTPTSRCPMNGALFLEDLATGPGKAENLSAYKRTRPIRRGVES